MSDSPYPRKPKLDQSFKPYAPESFVDNEIRRLWNIETYTYDDFIKMSKGDPILYQMRKHILSRGSAGVWEQVKSRMRFLKVGKRESLGGDASI